MVAMKRGDYDKGLLCAVREARKVGQWCPHDRPWMGLRHEWCDRGRLTMKVKRWKWEKK